MYFTSNDGSQNTFVYQPAHDTLEFYKDKYLLYSTCGPFTKHR